MMTNVYFLSAKKLTNPDALAAGTLQIFKKLVESEQLSLQKNLPIKIHSGEPGNTTFTRPQTYSDLIDHLLDQEIKPYYIETNTAAGIRSTKDKHLQVLKDHGFTDIPAKIADGEDGFDHVEVPIRNGKHFKTCKIAAGLSDQNQVLVMSHFKGHIMTGFGGAIKQLGIGFASGRGKTEAHAKVEIPVTKRIDWAKASQVPTGSSQIWNDDYVYYGQTFAERVAEYALAAVHGQKYIYLNFVINITANCDCDGEPMPLIYDDLGLLASTDPVAIDKACFDLLEKREGKRPFNDYGIFAYANQIGLGSLEYQLIRI